MIYGCIQQTQTPTALLVDFGQELGNIIAVLVSCFSLHANFNLLLCLSQSFPHKHNIITFIDSTSVAKSIYYKRLRACIRYRFEQS